MDGFDHAVLRSRDLEMLLSKMLGVFMNTDSKQLFKAMTSIKHTTERRLLVKFMGARQAYRKVKIAEIALVCGDADPADSLTKINDNGALSNIMRTMVDSTPVSQWIQRTGAPMQAPPLINEAAA